MPPKKNSGKKAPQHDLTAEEEAKYQDMIAEMSDSDKVNYGIILPSEAKAKSKTYKKAVAVAKKTHDLTPEEEKQYEAMEANMSESAKVRFGIKNPSRSRSRSRSKSRSKSATPTSAEFREMLEDMDSPTRRTYGFYKGGKKRRHRKTQKKSRWFFW